VYSYRFNLSRDAKTAILVEPTNRAAVLWDMLRMQPKETLDFAGTNLTGFAWSPDEATLVTADESGNVRAWDLARRQATALFRSPGAYAGHLSFTENGRFLRCGVLSSGKRIARIWRVEGWHEIPLPSDAMNRATWADVSPDGRLLLVLHYGGSLDMWDIASGRCCARFAQPFARTWEEGLVVFSPDGQSWVSSTQKGVVALWNTAGDRPPTILPRTTQEIWGLVFMEAGTRLLVTGRRSADVVRLLDMRSKRFVATLSGKPDVYWGARVSGDGSTVYAVGEKTILLWRAPSWADIGAAERGRIAP
jgi:WD40 repeat protein